MKNRRDEELDVWPAIADFKLALFIMALAVGLMVAGWKTSEKKSDRMLDEQSKLEEAFKQIVRKTCFPGPPPDDEEVDAMLDTCKKDIEQCRNKYNDCLAVALGPAFAEAGDSEGKRFREGEAVVESVKKLRGDLFIPLVAQVARLLPLEDDEDDILEGIEIVGHTDPNDFGHNQSGLNTENLRVPVKATGANCWETRLTSTSAKAGSNADLGLMRALAVAVEWENWVATDAMRDDVSRWANCGEPRDEARGLCRALREDEGRRLQNRLRKACLRPLSAAYILPPTKAGNRPSAGADGINEWDDKARRIELRFMRLDTLEASADRPTR